MKIDYDEETKTWVEAKEPFMTIDIETKEDYGRLNEALDAYYDNTAYITKDQNCSECGQPIGYKTVWGEIIPLDNIKYCYRCGRRFVEESDE